MTKIQRQQLNMEKAQILRARSESINSLISRAEPIIRFYWEYITACWKSGKIPAYAYETSTKLTVPWNYETKQELKVLNKQYRLLLKFN